MNRPPRIAVLRCAKLPGFVTWDIPDKDALFSDDHILIAELAKQGAIAESVAWSDAEIDWDSFDLALIRSTWDYIDDRDAFLDALAAIDSSSCLLLNTLETIHWNSDKVYLLDLAERGVPVVPTLRASGTDAAQAQRSVISSGWDAAVIKPVIGGGGDGVSLVAPGEVAETLRRLTRSHPGGQFLMQPLVEAIRTEGEWSYVFIEDELTHILLKQPAPGEFRIQSIYGGSLVRALPPPDDVSQAKTIMQRLPFDPLYTRLDLVRVDGRLAVMEVELVEPMLYFELAPHAATRLASACLARLAQRVQDRVEQPEKSGRDAVRL